MADSELLTSFHIFTGVEKRARFHQSRVAGGRGGQGEEDQAAANCDAGAEQNDIV